MVSRDTNDHDEDVKELTVSFIVVDNIFVNVPVDARTVRRGPLNYKASYVAEGSTSLQTRFVRGHYI